MSTPDAAAATPPYWKGQPVPEYGSTVKVTWLDTTGRSWKTRTATLIVRTISLADGGARLILSDGTTEARLAAGRLTDKWHTVLVADDEPAAPVFAIAPPARADQPTGPSADAIDLAGMQRRWLWVKDRVDEVDAELTALKKERDRLNDDIVNEVVELGLDAPPALDGMTFSLAPIYFAVYRQDDTGNRYTAADVVPVLRKLGMDTGIVTHGYNGNTFKAMLRERMEAGMEMPDELAELVELGSKSQVRATRSSASRRAGRSAAHH